MAASPCCAVALRICTADPPFQPFTQADGNGQLQQQLILAIQGMPIELVMFAAPRKRCLADAEIGQADALFAAFGPEREKFLTFPTTEDHQPDVSRAMAEVVFRIYRRKGSRVTWDGDQFRDLSGTIGVRYGFFYGSKLQRMRLPLDDGARTAEQLVEKLRLGRNEAILLQVDGASTTLVDRHADVIEPLPRAFDAFALYLAVTPRFYATHATLVKELWRRVAARRNSPGTRP